MTKEKKRMTVRVPLSLHRDIEAAARRFRFSSMNELSVAALRVALDMMTRRPQRLDEERAEVSAEVSAEFEALSHSEVQPQDVEPSRRRRRGRRDGDA